ncbi:hypothetical protein CPC08DRAFT_419573 [Agrocybe pediades]|nr:hypothetical protein CPC08DRAFT_419573 [Agrocybe pediades]
MFTTSVVCGTHFVLPISVPLRQQQLRLSSTFSAPPRHKPIHSTSSLPRPASATSFAASATSYPQVNLERSSESDANTSLSAALSQMTRSSAILAGTAFVIATSLIGLSAYGVVWGTKTGLGVDDIRSSHFLLIH